MAEPNKKPSPVVIGGAVALVATLIWYFATDTPKPVKKTTLIPKATTSSSTKKDVYLPEDYSAKFEPVSMALNNAFKPDVIKQKGVDPLSTIGSNGIPPGFVGGETTWIYTGNAEVDGIANALIENTATGEGVFLRPNEKWRNLVLTEVSGERITVEGPGGLMRTLTMPSTGGPEGMDMSVTPLPPVGAVPPGGIPGTRNPRTGALTGPIANMAPAMVNGQPNPAVPQIAGSDMTGYPVDDSNNGSNGRGRRRRNRNGSN